jgi:hypothetical protein
MPREPPFTFACDRAQLGEPERSTGARETVKPGPQRNDRIGGSDAHRAEVGSELIQSRRHR